MPIGRYFLFVGSALLGFLFFTDWYFPDTVASRPVAEIDRTVLRIHSAERWPEAAPLDTVTLMKPSVELESAPIGPSEPAHFDPVAIAFAMDRSSTSPPPSMPYREKRRSKSRNSSPRTARGRPIWIGQTSLFGMWQ
jgi:hypothetical protein